MVRSDWFYYLVPPDCGASPSVNQDRGHTAAAPALAPVNQRRHQVAPAISATAAVGGGGQRSCYLVNNAAAAVVGVGDG